MADWTSTPFVTSDWSVKWGDVAATATSFVLVSVFGGIANVIGAAFEIAIIPLNAVTETLIDVVDALFPAGLLSFDSATFTAASADWAGAAVAMGLLAVGVFIVARAVEVVR